uniref:Uncharacterized protein n=1 Tax=Salarias fasciatus TaxID=181472 RepID=A0A672GJ92_SALFA
MSAGGAAGGAMSSEQLIHKVALLQWLASQSEEDRGRLAVLTGLQVGRELLGRLTGRQQLDAYKVGTGFRVPCSRCAPGSFRAGIPQAAGSPAGGSVSDRCLLPQADCVLAIADFLKQNPRASQDRVAAEVQRNVLLFAARVRALETEPLF